MTFEKALEAMRHGNKVRRKDFPDTLYFIDDGFIKVFDRATEESIIVDLFSYATVLADDWEIYEEPQKEPEMTAEHAIENLERDTEPEHKCNACHCNCSHTGTDTNLQEEMKHALSRKFFGLEKSSDDESTVNSMLNIYNSIFPD
jgi:hypothetical protein